MKTIEVELALMDFFDVRRNKIVTNITAMTIFNFEVDLTVLTSSKYAHGFEIKVSKADFLKDFNKAHIKSAATCKDFSKNTYFKKLKYFSYAVPTSLVDIALEKVNPMFGIYEVREMNLSYRVPFLKVFEIRKPKQLSKKPWTDEDVYQFMRLGCMRIKTLKSRILELENRLK